MHSTHELTDISDITITERASRGDGCEQFNILRSLVKKYIFIMQIIKSIKK